MAASQTGMLSMVGTPIGNLADASPRVLDTLRAANLLLCEDTRHSSRLLAHFNIRVPLRRADEHVLEGVIEEVLTRIASGERVAFVSDAGMPGVSDPGQRLVDAALEAGLPLEVIPGPSAVTCALVASGLPMQHFFFEGFLPRKSGAIARRLTELALVPGALVFYESPRRVLRTLEHIAQCMPERKVALVRELTKLHEEVVRDVAPNLLEALRERDEIKGECVIVVAPPKQGVTLAQGLSEKPKLDEAIQTGLAAQESPSRLAKRLSKELALPRADIYSRILELRREA